LPNSDIRRFYLLDYHRKGSPLFVGNTNSMTKDFAYNCDPCKRRKKRCDRIQPCSNCVLYSCQSDCYSTLTQAKSLASTQGITASNQQRPIGVHTYADARHRRRSESPSEKYKKAYYSQDRYHDNAISTSSKPLERSKADKNSLVSELAFSLPALDMCFTFLDFAGTVSRHVHLSGLITEALPSYRYLTKVLFLTSKHCKSLPPKSLPGRMFPIAKPACYSGLSLWLLNILHLDIH
jgi:hypothetical protein